MARTTSSLPSISRANSPTLPDVAFSPASTSGDIALRRGAAQTATEILEYFADGRDPFVAGLIAFLSLSPLKKQTVWFCKVLLLTCLVKQKPAANKNA
jgi:hypothetical protein